MNKRRIAAAICLSLCSFAWAAASPADGFGSTDYMENTSSAANVSINTDDETKENAAYSEYDTEAGNYQEDEQPSAAGGSIYSDGVSSSSGRLPENNSWGAYSEGREIISGNMGISVSDSDVENSAREVEQVDTFVNISDLSASDYLSIMGAFKGTNSKSISDSISYSCTGCGSANFTCRTTDTSPTINEPFRVTCTASGARVTPSSVTFADTPVRGGKQKQSRNVNVCMTNDGHNYYCSDGTLTLDYTVFEGGTMMSGDIYNDLGSGSLMDSNGISNTAGSAGTTLYEVTGGGLDTSYMGEGSLTNAATTYMSGAKDSAEGVYGRNEEYGSDDSRGLGDLLGEKNESYNADASDWSSTSGRTAGSDNLDEYFGSIPLSMDGITSGIGGIAGGIGGTTGSIGGTTSGIDGITSGIGGTTGSIGGMSGGIGGMSGGIGGMTGSVEGYNGGNALRGSNVDNWREETGLDSSTVSIAEDLLGNSPDRRTDSEILNDILASGGYVSEDGQIFDADGNYWGTAEEAGTAPISPQALERVIEQGGYVDEKNNVHDKDGNVIGYAKREISENVQNKRFFDRQDMVSRIADILSDLLQEAGGVNTASLLEQFSGSERDVLDAVKEALGLVTMEGVKNETMPSQDMFRFAEIYLHEKGYSNKDIKQGKNYDADSAFTDPKAAWDMNRITTLQKNREIEIDTDEIKNIVKSK